MLYKVNTQFMKYETIESISLLLQDLESQKHEITTLDLSLNTFIPSVFLKICDKIKTLENLKHVILESVLDSLTFEQMCEFMDSLSNCLPLDLISLELPSNALSCNFPEKFANFLSNCPLKVLNLHNCGLGEDGLTRVVNCISKLENKTNLISLDLSKNRINVICPEFANVLSTFKSLERLILNANTIEENSMAQFLNSLQNKNLQVLNLTDNFVCGVAIEPLGELFLKNSFKELYLQDIKVDEHDINRLLKMMLTKDVVGLPGALEEPKHSLILDISCNNFDQDCIGILMKMLEKFYFEKLIIFDNDFEDCEDLKNEITSHGGRIIEEEEEEDFEPVEEKLLSMISNL